MPARFYLKDRASPSRIKFSKGKRVRPAHPCLPPLQSAGDGPRERSAKPCYFDRQGNEGQPPSRDLRRKPSRRGPFRHRRGSRGPYASRRIPCRKTADLRAAMGSGGPFADSLLGGRQPLDSGGLYCGLRLAPASRRSRNCASGPGQFADRNAQRPACRHRRRDAWAERADGRSHRENRAGPQLFRRRPFRPGVAVKFNPLYSFPKQFRGLSASSKHQRTGYTPIH
jgi:hypothetical protein